MKRPSIFLFMWLCVFCAGLLIFPKEATAGCIDGLRLCGSKVIPALFPFFVLSRLAISADLFGRLKHGNSRLMERLFGVSSAVVPCLLLSFIGGYPVGISTLISMYQNGRLTKTDAQRAMLFCNNSGPGFFIGLVGAVILNDMKAGLALYLIHCLSACLTGMFFRKPPLSGIRIVPVPERKTGQPPFSRLFLEAVSSSCSALLNISALVMFFTVLLRLAYAAGIISFFSRLFENQFSVPSNITTALLQGSLELSGGILSLTGLGKNAFIPAAFLLGWGGLCVHFQAASIWSEANLKPKGYYPAKLLHGGISAFLAWIYTNPTLLSTSLGVLLLLFVGIFPVLLKKRASIRRHYAV